MKIQNDESVINLNSVLKSSAVKDADKKLHQTDARAEDEVQLSPRAKEFQRIKDIVETIPDSRDEKVTALKVSIENGTYQSDSRKTAENLINESLIDLFV